MWSAAMAVSEIEIEDVSEQETKLAAEAEALKRSGDLPRISKPEYEAMMLDPEADQVRVDAYSVVEFSQEGMRARVRPDPDLVEMSELDAELESAMSIGNGLYRTRRLRQFERRLRQKPDMPVLVAEGDSWFQFPALVSDVIDHLSSGYNIACLSAAGDTAENMVFGPSGYGGREYLSKLLQHGDRVEAFLFSGAGNDIIGRNEATGERALSKLLKNPQGAKKPHEFINFSVLKDRLATLERYYTAVIRNIRAQPTLETLPIIFHGYDYVHPFAGADDNRTPLWARDGAVWLAPAFEEKGIHGQTLRREILIVLIDALYDMLDSLAGNSKTTHVWVTDCRKTLKTSEDWSDEIHPTSHSFFKIAKRFNKTIHAARTVGIGA